MRYQRSLSALIISLCASHSLAQTIPDQRYTHDAIATFWEQQVAHNPSNPSAIYDKILGDQDSAEGGGGSPIGDVIRGSDGVSNANFYVLPIPGDSIAQLSRREMALHMFVTKANGLEEPEADSFIEKIRLELQLREPRKILAQRQKQSAIELFLIKYIRYRGAGNLRQKCTYIQDAAFYRDLSASMSSTSSNSAIAELSSLQDAILAVSEYVDAINEEKACQMQDVRSRAQIINTVQGNLNAKIGESLVSLKDNTISAIESQVYSLDLLKQDITAIDPGSAGLLEAEQQMANAGAAIQIVNDDLFAVNPLVGDLLEIDLSKVETIGSGDYVPDPILTVEAARDLLLTGLGDLVSQIESEMGQVVSNPLTCRFLRSQYNAIEADIRSNQQPTGIQQFQNRVNDCILAFASELEQLTEVPEYTVHGQRFAHYLKQLSYTMIDVSE